MITITIVALTCGALILLLRSALSVAHVVLLPALSLALGCWLLVEEERARATTAAWVTISLVVLAVGYLLARRFTPRPNGPALRLGDDGGRRYVLVLVSFVGLFTLIHFAADGIPVLSGNVETSKFEFGKSLFGIPGRIYLYGLPLATGAALARSRQLGLRWSKDRLTLIAISLFTVSRLLSGFKGGLLEVLIVLLIAAVLAQGPVTSVAHVLRRYLPLVITAVIAVFLVGSLYSSYQGHGRSLPDIILARATTNGAFAGVIVFEKRLPRLPILRSPWTRSTSQRSISSWGPAAHTHLDDSWLHDLSRQPGKQLLPQPRSPMVRSQSWHTISGLRSRCWECSAWAPF